MKKLCLGGVDGRESQRGECGRAQGQDVRRYCLHAAAAALVGTQVGGLVHVLGLMMQADDDAAE